MSRRFALVLGLAATLLVAALLLLSAWREERSAGRRLGFGIDDTDDGLRVTGVTSGWPAAAAGLRQDDLVVALQGTPVPSVAEYERVAAGLRRGAQLHLGLLRDGESTTITAVAGVPFPWASYGFNTLACLGYLALAMLTLLQGLEDRRARLLFLFSAAVALELATPSNLPGPNFEWWSTAVYLVIPVLIGLQAGLELQLASHIPEPSGWFLARKWLPATYFAAGLLLYLPVTAVALGQVLGLDLPWTPGRVRSVADSWSMVAWAIAIVVILLAQLRQCKTPRHRHQVLLVLLGAAPWVLFSAALTASAISGSSLPAWVSDVFQPIALLVYPIAIFVAIFRYHLFDIELVVKRGLVYSTVTVTLVLLLYGAIGLGSSLFEEQVTGGSVSVWAASAVMLVVGLLFVPLRNAARLLVDRRLFPERLAMRQSLAELAAHLPALGNLSAIGQHLVTRVCEIFGFSSATLLVADPRSGVLVTLASSAVNLEDRFGESFLLEGTDPGVTMLRRAARPLRAAQVTPHSAALAQRLHAFGADLVLGLASGDSLTGLLLLGPKTSNERLLAEEQELLGLLSPMVATVLENVRLFESATYESLTGLLRREAILETLEHEMQRAQRYERPLAVGMADIDHFKHVNDTHGHLTGDALLKRVAQTLKAAMRSSDAIGRYGGEEFLFCLPETDLAGAVRVAEKLRRAVEHLKNPVEGAVGLRVTISVGLAELEPGAGEYSTEGLIAAADANLLAAKRQGRNRVMPAPREHHPEASGIARS